MVHNYASRTYAQTYIVFVQMHFTNSLFMCQTFDFTISMKL